MNSKISSHETDFKAALQRAEREIMASFAFKKELPMGTTAHSSLSETMELKGDHIELAYLTSFEGADLKDIS